MNNFETKFEKLDITNEPEIKPEFAPPQADTTDWSSLSDVPFAGDIGNSDLNPNNESTEFEPLGDSDIGD